MSKKAKRTDSLIGEVKVVDDFLPLAARDPGLGTRDRSARGRR